ncbi:hypothetical protein B0H19DRAFT_1270286 [Mycena capillaripes]|nr:hypothetical protein B0H19DRAFT_1270286 [Mycena capillaripes]
MSYLNVVLPSTTQPLSTLPKCSLVSLNWKLTSGILALQSLVSGVLTLPSDNGVNSINVKLSVIASLAYDLVLGRDWLLFFRETLPHACFVSPLFGHLFALISGQQANMAPKTTTGAQISVTVPSLLIMGQFNETIGAMLLGVTINTYLTGTIMPQFYTYWTSGHQDRWWIRSLVAFLFILNAAQAIAVVYMSWFYCVTNFANSDIIATTLWPNPFTALITAILALVFQTFQSWRIYVFTKSKVLVAFLLVTALATCGMGVGAAIQALIIHRLSQVKALLPQVQANLALQCAMDVAIAVILTMAFSQSKTSFPKTDRVLDRLIRTAIQSGAFTALFALGTLLMFRLFPETQMITLFALPIGRIYTHTIMDHLITREQLRRMLSNGKSVSNFPVTPTETLMLGTPSMSSKDPETAFRKKSNLDT